MRGYKILTSIGRKIQLSRREQGISQEKLADMVGIHRNHMGRIERGENNTPIYTLYKVARALKVNSFDLFPF